MGTRADFYVGRGKGMKYLGSIAWDGYPSGVSTELLMSRTEADFKRNLKGFSLVRDDWSSPEEHGWPWPWDDSRLTDYVYAFDNGEVWISYVNSPWFKASDIPRDKDGKLLDGRPYYEWQEAHIPEGGGKSSPNDKEFPDMKKIKRVTFGGRSGVVVIGGDPSERIDKPGSKVEITGDPDVRPGKTFLVRRRTVPVRRYVRRKK